MPYTVMAAITHECSFFTHYEVLKRLVKTVHWSIMAHIRSLTNAELMQMKSKDFDDLASGMKP